MTRVAAGNIGVQGQNKRFRLGLWMFALSTAATVVALETHVGRGVLGLLFLPFMVSALAFYQGLYGNCFSLAMQGKRDRDDGVETIVDRCELARGKRTGRRTILAAALTASAMTLLVQLVH